MAVPFFVFCKSWGVDWLPLTREAISIETQILGMEPFLFILKQVATASCFSNYNERSIIGMR